MRALFLLPLILPLAHCGGSGSDPCADRPEPDGMTTPLLDECHPGYKEQNCGSCHDVPLPMHWITNTAECSGCHGGNGACNPPGETSRSDDCRSCHDPTHGYELSNDCSMCHFAFDGVVDCG